jgi:site-specific recombinase XerD
VADELILRPKSGDIVRREGETLPELILQAGKAAETAWDDFFQGKLANRYTRAAYSLAVRRFLDWADVEGRELHQVTAGDVGRYLEQHPGSLPTKKQHLSALRRFFNLLVDCNIEIGTSV